MPSNQTYRSPLESQSLLDTRALSANDILFLFQKAEELSHQIDRSHGSAQLRPQGTVVRNLKPVIACVFFEPSTRTRMSFQTAAYRLGCEVLTMEMASSSSLTKGESYADTVLNIAAMKPDAIVIRYGRSLELDELLPTLSIPVLNAGSGTQAHPTQALLDAFTIQKEMGSVKGRKVLIVGDIRHSRVARSNFDVLSKLGAEIGICGPAALMPHEAESLIPGLKVFAELDEAIGWADVYMGLRIQLERHNAEELNLESLADYHEQFGLSDKRLKLLRSDAVILHPGPINHGVEFSEGVVRDSRSRVLNQVTNGVLIRAALLEQALHLRRT
jgi:aspartate carbamoyltransferase catalytic subunit